MQRVPRESSSECTRESRVPWAFLPLEAKNYPMLLLGTLDAERQLAPLVRFLPGPGIYPLCRLDLRNRAIQSRQLSPVEPSFCQQFPCQVDFGEFQDIPLPEVSW